MENLEAEIKNNPEKYTVWLTICFPKVKKYYQETFKNNLLKFTSI
jgi:hypothetical protein